MVKDTITTGSIQRSFHIGKLGFGIAGSYVGYQVQNMFLDEEAQEQNKKSFQKSSAKKIRGELQNLRGPIMKLGQVLSMQSHSIPEEMIEELAELQMHAPPMHPTLMRTQFKKSMGNYPEELFESFDIEPFAAASLGQVHHAVTPAGEPVAVKIQYPAIRKAVENDFAALRSATLPFRLTNYVTKEMLQEIERGILQETDYHSEAQNIDFFTTNLSELAYVTVPNVYGEYSSEKVITMSLMPGKHLDDFLQTNPSQTVRDRLGKHLFELFFFQIFQMKALHSDPHPGNYLFCDDGKISLIDFGCVKYIPQPVVDVMHEFSIKFYRDGKYDSVNVLEFMFGDQTDSSNEEQQQLLIALNEFCMALYPPDEQLVDFGNPEIFNKMTNVWKQVIHSKHTKSEFFFIKRAELGLYNILYKLGAHIKTSGIVKKILQWES